MSERVERRSSEDPNQGVPDTMNFSDAEWAARSEKGNVGVVGCRNQFGLWRLGGKGEGQPVPFASDDTEGSIFYPPALSADGRWLAWADGPVVKLFDVSKLDGLQEEQVPTVLVEPGGDYTVPPPSEPRRPSMNAIVLSSDARWLAAACGDGTDGTVRVWDLQDLQRVVDHLAGRAVAHEP